MRNVRIMMIALLLIANFPHAAAAESSSERPRIGLALSGGGARGGAHVGVLKAIEVYGVPIDYIAGTSMGAIIGALYASGYSADEIETVLKETDWNAALKDSPDRTDQTMRKKELESQFLIRLRVGFNGGKIQLPLGAVNGQHLAQIFQVLFLPVVDIHEFDRLPIPFRAVATDLVSGEAVVLSSGSLSDSVRASMSVPAVFTPVRLGGHLLVDGGMSNNLPVDVVREMGADIVIAVDISSPLLEEEELESILSITEQLTNFLTRRNADAQIASLGPDDVLIVPELGEFSSADFEGAAGIIPLGYEASILQRDVLLKMAVTPDDDPVPFLPQSSDDYIVEFVTYDMVTDEAGQRGVVVNAVPRSWGPNYLQFGLELASDFSSQSDFLLGAAYTHNALNSLGG